MMALLEQRANFLIAGKFTEANEIEKKMTALKKDKYDDLTKPKAFFCTFHKEQAYHQALFTAKFEFEGQDNVIELTQATEPTDIVWENRHIQSCERGIRWTIALMIMALCAFAAFTFIVWLIKKKLLI